MAFVTPLALQRKPVGAQLLWRRTLALRIICDQALRGAFAARGPAVVNGRADAARPAVALAAYRERVRRFAAYLADRRLPRLSRVLLSHHWSAWAAVFGATPQRKAACAACGRDRGAAPAVSASPAALGCQRAFACAFCASHPLDKALFSVKGGARVALADSRCAAAARRRRACHVAGVRAQQGAAAGAAGASRVTRSPRPAAESAAPRCAGGAPSARAAPRRAHLRGLGRAGEAAGRRGAQGRHAARRRLAAALAPPPRPAQHRRRRPLGRLRLAPAVRPRAGGGAPAPAARVASQR